MFMKILKKILSGFLASSSILLVDCGAIFAQRSGKRNNSSRNMSSVSKASNSKIDSKLVKENNDLKKNESVTSGFLENDIAELEKENKSKRNTVAKEGVGVVRETKETNDETVFSKPFSNRRRTGLFFDDNYSSSFNRLLRDMEQTFADFSSEFDNYFSDGFSNEGGSVSNALTPVSKDNVEKSSEIKSKSENGSQMVKKDSFDLDNWSNLGKEDGGKYEKFEQNTGDGRYLCERYVSKDGKTRRERRVFYKSGKA